MDMKRIQVSTAIPRSQVSTLLTAPPGYKLQKSLGIVRGVTVRSRNLVASIGAGFKSLVGGKIDTFKTLCEDARVEAYNHMIEDAVALGANAVIGVGYDTCDLGEGIAEVLCYGTAVILAME